MPHGPSMAVPQPAQRLTGTQPSRHARGRSLCAGERDVPVSQVFTPAMWAELKVLMTAQGWGGVEETEATGQLPNTPCTPNPKPLDPNPNPNPRRHPRALTLAHTLTPNLALSLNQAMWLQSFGARPIITGFMKDRSLGEKRLTSMPDRVTNTAR